MAENLLTEFLPLVNIDMGTIFFTLANTLIIFLLYRFLLHKKVLAILDKRKETVSEELDAATKAKEAAKAAEDEYNARLADSKAEAQRIVSEAVTRAQSREAEIIADAEKSAVSIKEKAQESIERDKKRAVNEIKDQISELVVMAAGKVAEKEISAKDNEQLIDSFLVKVGSK